jgi:hypothetical protein
MRGGRRSANHRHPSLERCTATTVAPWRQQRCYCCEEAVTHCWTAVLSAAAQQEAGTRAVAPCPPAALEAAVRRSAVVLVAAAAP